MKAKIKYEIPKDLSLENYTRNHKHELWKELRKDFSEQATNVFRFLNLEKKEVSLSFQRGKRSLRIKMADMNIREINHVFEEPVEINEVLIRFSYHYLSTLKERKYFLYDTVNKKFVVKKYDKEFDILKQKIEEMIEDFRRIPKLNDSIQKEKEKSDKRIFRSQKNKLKDQLKEYVKNPLWDKEVIVKIWEDVLLEHVVKS